MILMAVNAVERLQPMEQDQLVQVASPTQSHSRELLELPSDLGIWIPEERLVWWSKELTQEWLSLAELQAPWEDALPQLRSEWLSLLIFCYLTGRWSSVCIYRELILGESPLSRFEVEPGSWQDLVEFRRLSRNTLRCCIASLLQRAWQAWETGVNLTTSGALTTDSHGGYRPMNSPTHTTSTAWFLMEADARIRLAIGHDRQEVDE